MSVPHQVPTTVPVLPPVRTMREVMCVPVPQATQSPVNMAVVVSYIRTVYKHIIKGYE
jgi:hypothetical protein